MSLGFEYFEQKALKEKEEHVDQLLMERDMDRSEVAKTAIKVEEVFTAVIFLFCKHFVSLMLS